LSTLKEQAEIDINMFMETGLPWVDQAVFTPQVGDPVSLNVILEKEEVYSPDDFSTRISDQKYRVEMLFADIGQIPIARTPTRTGDIFLINEIEYEVTESSDQNNKFISCSVRVKD
jgi:hypothetical protein